MKTAKLERSLHINPDFAIEILSSRRQRIDDDYKRKLVGYNAYVHLEFLLNTTRRMDKRKMLLCAMHTHLQKLVN